MSDAGINVSIEMDLYSVFGDDGHSLAGIIRDEVFSETRKIVRAEVRACAKHGPFKEKVDALVDRALSQALEL